MSQMHPEQVLWNLVNSSIIARSVQVVAESGVADHVTEQPTRADDLAAKTGMNPDALNRMLRLLAAYGVFAEEGGGYLHTPASELLRTDHPQSMRSFARMMNLPIMLDSFAGLSETGRTGKPVLDWAGFVSYFASHPEESGLFNQAMAAKSAAIVPAVVEAYDFSQFGTIADIGGGQGHLLRGILESAPKASGILFDLPHVTAEAADGGSERFSVQAGDFFTDKLPSTDAYLMMEVLHDWNDEDAVKILRSVRSAASKSSRLLIIESLIPDRPGPHPSKVLDLIMLAVTGGRERTPDEYTSLLELAGFRFQSVVPTASPYSIVEAAIA